MEYFKIIIRLSIFHLNSVEVNLDCVSAKGITMLKSFTRNVKQNKTKIKYFSWKIVEKTTVLR